MVLENTFWSAVFMSVKVQNDAAIKVPCLTINDYLDCFMLQI